MLKYLILLPVLSFLNGCGGSDPEETTLRGNVDRKAVGEETWRALSGLKWDDEQSFGSIGNYYGTTPSAFPKEYQGLYFGINENNYERFSTKGDGNCWIRAGLRVFFHNIFSDQKLYIEFLEAIDTFSTRYAIDELSHPIVDHPKTKVSALWLKNFPWQNFKDGIIFLKENFESQKYLHILNHHNVDWFFIAAMRAIHGAELERQDRKRRYYLGFNCKTKKYKQAAEIEEFWKELIEQGKNLVDEYGNKIACGESTNVTTSGKNKSRIKFCSRAEIIKHLKEEHQNKADLGPATWGNPLTFSYTKKLGRFFLIQTLNTYGSQACEWFRHVKARSVMEYKCVAKHRKHLPQSPVFYDFYTEILPIHVNGNHYDVLVRKPKASFDYEAFYKTIKKSPIRSEVRSCLERL